MPEVQEVFRMATQKVRPDPGFVDRQYDHRRMRERKRKIGALAVAAVIMIVAAVAIARNLDAGVGNQGTTPADAPATVNPVSATAERVATSFLEAYGAFNVEQAITYLADDADISQLSVGAQAVQGLKEFRLLISWLEAQGYKQMLNSCEELGSSAFGTRFRCTFDFHALRSDEIGLGPFSGSYFDLTVRDGEIVRASLYWDIEEFSPQMWEPFASWVSTTYPVDAAVMYEDETYSGARLTEEESIRLWERHSREYVKEVGGRTEGQ
ncbi:MAG TPA: hypothetical protein VGR41_03395 [Actinomycetota bacterium]|jgi:hypothetical protein|nr:hypothetical protein [Actinomycetota bacterium]